MDLPLYIPLTLPQLEARLAAVVRQELHHQQTHSPGPAPTLTPVEELLSPAQAAEFFGVCKGTVFEWLRRGLLSAAAVKVGGKRYFKRSALATAGTPDQRPDGRRQTSRRVAGMGDNKGVQPKAW
ncbi:helix-turn-helix domain-containing protein [Hymenobacter armeniacus]|uniref:Helix-turn-helix domain-containing protein n=1 Tax=Hymenobacter armeniacus TaxID=2771358 RepID=A0ABR8JSC3_9BACT|nr:helix-turn-helix domain-containing protein [Hymenobacter armeniacus]MBD2722202.1 helix-turn-helix domain-containing protein [Hymenobacter armeniacus]